MKWQIIVATILAGVALMGLTGCYGPSPGLNPSIAFSFPDDSSLPYLQSGGKLVIKGEANPPVDAASNPVISASWSQDPPIGQFVITSPNAVENIWQAPAVTQATPVTLALSMKTLLGGEGSTRMTVIVVPQLPSFTFDTSRMSSEVAGFPSAVKSGASVTIRGSGQMSDAGFNTINGYQWTATADVKANSGTFDSSTKQNPVWTAPTLAQGAQPVPVSLIVQMSTSTGLSGTSKLDVTVVP